MTAAADPTRRALLGADFARAVNQPLGSYERNAAGPGGARARAVLAVHYFDAPAQAPGGRRE